MTLDSRMFYFTSAATIRQLLDVLLKEINVRKEEKKGRKGCVGCIHEKNHSTLNLNEPFPLV
jgi:hypothetical protein